jgi:hypothetical protein
MRAELAGFQLDATRVRPSEEYLAARGDAPRPEYRWLRLKTGGAAAPDAWLDDQHRVCVSDRMMAVLRDYRLDRCEIDRCRIEFSERWRAPSGVLKRGG